ncbi:MAG: hypothetical protein QXW97_03100 [Candidatus Pacearchaeota archaeon]
MVNKNSFIYTEESITLISGAIIKRAIDDITLYSPDTLEYQRAIKWLCHNGKNGYYISFNMICEAYEVEPSFLRKKIYNLPKVNKKLKKIGILEELLKMNTID